MKTKSGLIACGIFLAIGLGTLIPANAEDWLGDSQQHIRKIFQGKLPLAPIFGDADEGDLFDGSANTDQLWLFGYKQKVVVYAFVRKRKGTQTLSEAQILDHFQKSKSGGRWTVVATEPGDNNPDRTYSHEIKGGNDFVATGFRGKENGKRKRVLTYSKEWNGNPDAVIKSQVLGLDPDQMILFLKQEGVTNLESKAVPK